MKICPIYTFQIGTDFPVESNIFGNYPMFIKDGFIIFRVTGTDGQMSYGFLTMLYPENEEMIRPHEKVIAEKVFSKREEAEAESTFNKPVCLLYELNDLLTKHVISGFDSGQIITHLQAENGLYEYAVHDNADWANKLIDLFVDQDSLVIADGHHRTAAYFDIRNESIEDPGLFSAIMSMNQVVVRSYHRKIQIKETHYADFHALLRSMYIFHDFSFEKATEMDYSTDSEENCLLMYDRDGWNKLKPKNEESKIRPGSADLLARFESGILIPFCRQAGLQTYDIIQFISGSELNLKELRLKSDEVLFLFPPVSKEFLWASSHRGEILPAKSTWIEPRIPSDVIQAPYTI